MALNPIVTPAVAPSPAGEGFIRLSNLSKTYLEGDRRRVVLEDASADFAQGEFIALLGRSGSGKSTLLNLVSGIDAPDAGRIWVGGQELTPRELRHTHKKQSSTARKPQRICSDTAS
jgi:ABC-type lipoprotein export system ATPase subunit